VRVGLNCVFLVPGETGGMETYARGLLPRLASLGVEPVAFVNREAEHEQLGVATVLVPVDARDRVQWVRGEQLLLPRLAAKAGCEIVHSLGSTAPLRGRFRRVTTIHDLHYKTVPSAHFGLRARGMAALVPAGARRAHRVLADSEQTRADILEHIGLPAERVEVVPLGVQAPAPGAATPTANLRDRFGLARRRVVLTTGGTRPHKNVARLVEALRDADDTVLVVTGYATPEDAALLGEPHVVRTGHVAAADLDGLYALADVVCAPSLSEGFGMPVLEAMVRGVPVACSATGALAEVAGDAARAFDPTDVASIRAALLELLADPAQRERLAAAGRERAAQFTWERTARLTVDAYRRVLDP
jgi:glycosyltransferase involved in cell wall biosynthesis